jgi:leader peptidase (prepilin peptidase)/N-methyltransferase
MSIVVGGLVGCLVNIVATRLPEDLSLIGLPLTTSTNQPSTRALAPYVGAWDRIDRKIDWPNFGTQLGAAAVAALSLWVHGFSLSATQAIVLASILLIILRIDWQHHLIFVLTIWPGIIIALIFAGMQSLTSLASSAIAGLAAAAVFLVLYLLALLIYRKRALGFGDVLLAGLIGTMVGLQFVTLTLIFGMVVAAVGALFLIAARIRSRTDYIPYGAYLSLAAIVMVILVS